MTNGSATDSAAAGGTGAPYRVGNVLSRGFSIYLKNIIPFGVIMVLATVPYIIVMLIGVASGSLEGLVTFISIATIVQILCMYIAMAAISYGTFQEMRGQHVGLGASISKGLALILPVLGVAIVSGLGIIVGMILLIIPGLFLLTMWWVAIPAAVVERQGVGASLTRSADLTRGYRWAVFGTIVVVWIVYYVINWIVQLIVQGVLGSAVTPGASAGAILTAIGLTVIVSTLVVAFVTPFTAVMPVVAYHDLRVAKEGIAIEDIAKVFD